MPPSPRETSSATVAHTVSVDAALIDKVRKLLTMAERSPHPGEAEAFSRKAAELIAAHRIDPGRIQAGADDSLDVLQVALGRGAYVRGRLALLEAVGSAHGCRTVFDTFERGTRAYVAGFRSDLATVELLYHSLHTQAASQMAGARRATPAATQQWRRSFLFGYADRIGSMLTVAATEAARSAHPSNAALPALRSRDKRVEEYVRQRFGRIGAARHVKRATAGGWHAGHAAAARADIARQRLAPLRALGRGA